MQQEFHIREIFRLSHGVTVLACEGGDEDQSVVGRRATLVVHGEIRQTILLTGERHMLKQSSHLGQRAFETNDIVEILDDHVRSGGLKMLVD